MYSAGQSYIQKQLKHSHHKTCHFWAISNDSQFPQIVQDWYCQPEKNTT